MDQVLATKSNLMAAKKSLSLSKVGYDLMDRKRTFLMREMMRLMDEAKTVESEIKVAYEKAFVCLKKANLSLGDLSKFADLAEITDDFEVDYKSVMGVVIPVITSKVSKKIDIKTFGFSTTNRDFDETIIAFSKVKELTIKLAEIECSVLRLADGVSKTQKRSNALKNVSIPRLESTIKFISSDLDEKEREEFSRLKVIKKSKA